MQRAHCSFTVSKARYREAMLSEMLRLPGSPNPSLLIMDTNPYGAERASCKLRRKSEAMNHGAGHLLRNVCLNRLQIEGKAA